MGYRGDGSCVAKGNPPVRWDSIRNVKWRVPLANWGYGCPVPAGGRVFLMTEPGWKHDFPVLNCFDANTGKLLWQKEVNQLPATGLPEQEQQKTLKAYREVLANWRQSYQLFHEWKSGKDQAAKDTAVKRMGEIGLQFDPKTFNASYGALRKAKFPWKEFCWKKAGFQSETWQHGCGYSISAVGQCFPTPVTDGKSIYVATAFMGFACYNFAGNLKWIQFSPGSYGGKWGVDYCKFARSPLLYKNLMISDLADVVRAFDKETGKLVWKKDLTGGKCTSMVLPVIITVDRTDILLSKDRAFRLPNGEELKIEEDKPKEEDDILMDDEEDEDALPAMKAPKVKPKPGWKPCGITRLVKHDEPNIVFFTGGGEHGNWPNKGNCPTPPPLAVRFTLKDNTLLAKILWTGINKQRASGHTGIVYHNGKLYHPGGCILDAKTGEVLTGVHRKTRATPETRHLLWIAGGHVYGIKSHSPKGSKVRQGICEVYDLAGKKVASNVLPAAKVEGEKATQIVQQTGYPSWQFSYSSPFTIDGDRIYIRSNDELWCIGK